VLAGSAKKKRKFTETIELQIALKNYDQNKDKRFSGVLRLPAIPKPKFTVCVFGDAKHCGEAAEKNIPNRSENDLKKLNKNKKAVKKLANEFDGFLASSSLIRKIPRLLGPGLNKAGKFPTQLGNNESIDSAVENMQASVKFQLKSKKSNCLGLAVANVGQDKETIVANLSMAINFFVNLLPKHWQQVKKLYIKSTMGKPEQIFGY